MFLGQESHIDACPYFLALKVGMGPTLPNNPVFPHTTDVPFCIELVTSTNFPFGSLI
jgi:hypothetical protein